MQLGHQRVNVKATALNRSPCDPHYLREATAAIADFYAQVDALVTSTLWQLW